MFDFSPPRGVLDSINRHHHHLGHDHIDVAKSLNNIGIVQHGALTSTPPDSPDQTTDKTYKILALDRLFLSADDHHFMAVPPQKTTSAFLFQHDRRLTAALQAALEKP
eukprot:2155590-Rhodomonas_salina.1